MAKGARKGFIKQTNVHELFRAMNLTLSQIQARAVPVKRKEKKVKPPRKEKPEKKGAGGKATPKVRRLMARESRRINYRYQKRKRKFHR